MHNGLKECRIIYKNYIDVQRYYHLLDKLTIYQIKEYYCLIISIYGCMYRCM